MQDYHDLPTSLYALDKIIDAKWTAFQPIMAEATTNYDIYRWTVNFASAACVPWAGPRGLAAGSWNFWYIKDGMNGRILDEIAKQQPTSDYGLGLVVLDFPELPNNDLIAALVMKNTFTAS